MLWAASSVSSPLTVVVSVTVATADPLFRKMSAMRIVTPL